MIHIERMLDGARRVVAITEVQRMESEVITLQDLYAFHVEGVARRHVVGSLKATGFRPSFAEKFERRGIEVPVGALASQAAASSGEREQIRAGRATPNGKP
jgi:pilus assembly protein CpaF